MTRPFEYQPGSPGDLRPRDRTPLTIRYTPIGISVFGIGAAGLFTFFGSASGLALFKLFALLMLLLAGFGTVTLLRRYSAAIHSPRAVLALLLLSVIPYLRIAVEVLPTFGARQIIDGLIIFGSYYLLPFTGLGLVACLASTTTSLDTIIRRALPALGVLVALLALGGFLTFNTAEVAGVYTVYNNLAIPAALLVFFPSRRRNLVIGLTALVVIFALATLQASRSYLLVFLYLGSFALFFGPYRVQMKLLMAALLFLAFSLAGPIAIQFMISEGTDAAIVDKLRLDTLLPVLAKVFESGDLLELYLWDGNSRSTILTDAFLNFNAWDYMWGRGVTATYDSFVTRTTIEIGYAQELFWLGLMTVIPTLVYALVALFGIVGRRSWRRGALGAMMVSVGITRILDGMIYGLPSLSLYSLFFWMFIMQIALKQRYRHALFRKPQVEGRPG